MSVMLRDLSGIEGAIEGGPYPSNLDLVAASLSGKHGPLANFILEELAFCFEEVPEDEMRAMLELREGALSKVDELIEAACANIEENRGHCYRAGDRGEALRIVRDLTGDGRIVIKSFDWLVEEVGVGEGLSEDNEVLDTAVPLAAPSLISRLGEEPLVRRLRDAGLNVSGDVEGFLSRHYRDRLYRAGVGITGVRAVAADPGAMAFLPDSGIDRLVTMTPEVHIILAGLEDVVPTYADAFRLAEFMSKYSPGSYSFLGFVGGPSKTGDIEKRVTYGAHGPREFHVVFVDDGRKNAIKGELGKALICPRASKLPCPDVWPLWDEILGLKLGEGKASGRGSCPFP